MKIGGVINVIKKILPADPKVVIKNKPAARRSDLGGLTPLLGMALSGGLLGLGMAIPAPFAAACQSFVTNGVSGLCQTALGACGPLVQSALGSLPGGLSGMASGITAASLGELGINTDNVVGGCFGQAQQLFSNETTGFMETCAAANSFCEGSFNACAAMQQFTGLNLANGDLGFNLTNFQNCITAGITAQFGPLTDSVKTVFSNLGKCGSMLDCTNLSKAFTASGLAENLINQGFGEDVLGALEKVGINSVDELITGNETLISQALDSIPSDRIEEIVKQTGYLGSIPETLTEVIQKPASWLGQEFESIATSGKEFAEKLYSTIGTPVAKSFEEIGQALTQLATVPTPNLDAANSDRNVWESYWADPAEIKSTTGSGSGIFGNPTIADVIGVAAGLGYTSRILSMSESQQRLLATPEGQALEAAINSAIANPSDDAANAAAIAAAAAPFINPTNAGIKQEVSILEENFQTVANKLITETRNLAAAQIDLTENIGSLNSVLTFVGNLHSLHEDPKYLGYAEFIKEVTTNDVYGEAIRAAIIEGKNLKLLEAIGFQPQVSLDAEAYGEQVLSQNTTDICCPPAG